MTLGLYNHLFRRGMYNFAAVRPLFCCLRCNLTALETFLPADEDLAPFLRWVLIFVRRFLMSFIDKPAIPRLTTRFVFPRFTRRRVLKFWPFLCNSRQAVVHVRRAAFFFWKYSDLLFELINCAMVPSRRTTVLPCPGKILKSQKTHGLVLITIVPKKQLTTRPC